MISEGHKNYELMLNLQLGIKLIIGLDSFAFAFTSVASVDVIWILGFCWLVLCFVKFLLICRYFVGKHASITRVLKLADFDPKEKFWTRFPIEGSKCTPPHQSVDFRWKDYCPMVFRFKI
ncbi:hypothetical protein CsSME_00031881 [Camellia sinensis var. sinensis]